VNANTSRGLALAVEGIEKRYGAIRALKGVSLTVEP
jgi:ABC-type sugar transport system ATPase subunit